MTFAQELQSMLGVGLYPLGITVHKGRLTEPAKDAYYLIYDPDETPLEWANNKPLIVRQDVEIRYYAKRAPLPADHIEAIARILRDMGMHPDGGPEPAPTLAPTDYVGEITDWTRTVAVDGK